MIKLLYIDLFCGAGGTSTGVNSARLGGEQCAKVIACVNHDSKAIASHRSNHPDALHFTEDIRTLNLTPLIKHLDQQRTLYPEAKIVLWASLECTNFSKAKGGQPRDADSRTLAEHLFRYIHDIEPDFIQIENVAEFMSWGDMDENGRPISMDKGRLYTRWVKNVKACGYTFEHRILNAADYGAYTTRKRFFGIFAKRGLPIIFPEPTHTKGGIEKAKKRWHAVKEVLDLDDEGKSIFNRRRPLSEKTLLRIYAGLVKFIAGGKDAFIIKWNSINQKTGKYIPPDLDDPCPTVACQNRLGIAKVVFLSKQFSGHPDSKNISIEEPAGTITCRDHHAIVSCERFISMQYGNSSAMSLDEPTGCIVTRPKQSLVSVKHFIMNPQYASKGGSVEDPCFTLIASMNKRPPYLVTTESGEVAIEIYDTDSPMTVKIKEFMAMYSIVDIKVRMFKVEELLQIQGFPKNYVLLGNQEDKQKFIGNAVEVNMARALCESLASAV